LRYDLPICTDYPDPRAPPIFRLLKLIQEICQLEPIFQVHLHDLALE
jgi:hypothetical protein